MHKYNTTAPALSKSVVYRVWNLIRSEGLAPAEGNRHCKHLFPPGLKELNVGGQRCRRLLFVDVTRYEKLQPKQWRKVQQKN